MNSHILVSYSLPLNIPSSAEPNGLLLPNSFPYMYLAADNAHTNRAGQLQFTKGEISKRPVLFTGDY